MVQWWRVFAEQNYSKWFWVKSTSGHPQKTLYIWYWCLFFLMFFGGQYCLYRFMCFVVFWHYLIQEVYLLNLVTFDGQVSFPCLPNSCTKCNSHAQLPLYQDHHSIGDVAQWLPRDVGRPECCNLRRKWMWFCVLSMRITMFHVNLAFIVFAVSVWWHKNEKERRRNKVKKQSKIQEHYNIYI